MAFLTRQSGVVRQIVGVECLARARNPTHRLLRSFHASSRRDIIKPFLLADIGEGTRECQIIQWFVRPGARVQQFDKICEVQSDKAATDITSPFDGVVKKLYYEADDTAIVGKPLLDIDIQSEISPENESLIDTSAGENGTKSPTSTKEGQQSNEGNEEREEILGPLGRISQQREDRNEHQQKGSNSHRTLATPAVRHLTKEFKVDIANIKGTGKDGRVLKEDVHRHVAQREEPSAPSPVTKAADDRRLPLTPIQNQMFKTMTRSLTIPHFLYTSTVDATNLTALRTKLNRSRAAEDRLTPLPFILKAISLAFTHHPLLNASLDTTDTKSQN
ncbi:hypothetical protein H2203_003222 [Taxawa tesnikishii (nom. ined.)]|nr:hypothetical protein H2203_003222 [Dothideales sp. JES 119]